MLVTDIFNRHRRWFMYDSRKRPGVDYVHPTLGRVQDATQCNHATPNTWMYYRDAKSISDATGFLFPGYAHGGKGRHPYVSFLDIDYDKFCAICRDYNCNYDGHTRQHMIRDIDFAEATPKIKAFLLYMEKLMGGKMPWQRSISGKGTHFLFTIDNDEADKYKYIGGKLIAQITEHAKIETWNPTGSGRGRLVASETVNRSSTIPTIKFDDYRAIFPPVLNEKQQKYKKMYGDNNSWKSAYYDLGTDEVVHLLEQKGYDAQKEYNSPYSYRIHANEFQCHDSSGGSVKMGNPSVHIGNKYNGEFQITCHSECGNAFMRLHEILKLKVTDLWLCHHCNRTTAYTRVCSNCQNSLV